jgi:hypothetical protein
MNGGFNFRDLRVVLLVIGLNRWSGLRLSWHIVASQSWSLPATGKGFISHPWSFWSLASGPDIEHMISWEQPSNPGPRFQFLGRCRRREFWPVCIHLPMPARELRWNSFAQSPTGSLHSWMMFSHCTIPNMSWPGFLNWFYIHMFAGWAPMYSHCPWIGKPYQSANIIRLCYAAIPHVSPSINQY